MGKREWKRHRGEGAEKQADNERKKDRDCVSVFVCFFFLCFFFFFRKSENVEGRKRGVKQGQ